MQGPAPHGGHPSLQALTVPRKENGHNKLKEDTNHAQIHEEAHCSHPRLPDARDTVRRLRQEGRRRQLRRRHHQARLDGLAHRRPGRLRHLREPDPQDDGRRPQRQRRTARQAGRADLLRHQGRRAGGGQRRQASVRAGSGLRDHRPERLGSVHRHPVRPRPVQDLRYVHRGDQREGHHAGRSAQGIQLPRLLPRSPAGQDRRFVRV